MVHHDIECEFILFIVDGPEQCGCPNREIYRLRDELAEAQSRLEAVLGISRDEVGQIMHESWSRTKREQGFHGPDDECTYLINCGEQGTGGPILRCNKFHPDLIPWDLLPPTQQDLNLHAFDDVLDELRRRGTTHR